MHWSKLIGAVAVGLAIRNMVKDSMVEHRYDLRAAHRDGQHHMNFAVVTASTPNGRARYTKISHSLNSWNSDRVRNNEEHPFLTWLENLF